MLCYTDFMTSNPAPTGSSTKEPAPVPPTRIFTAESLSQQAKKGPPWGKIFLIILIIIAIVGVAGAGGYYYFGPKIVTQNISQNPTGPLVVTPEPKGPTPTPYPYSFQTALINFCKKTEISPLSFYYKIDLTKLPINFPNSTIFDTSDSKAPKCWGTAETDWITLSTTSNNSFAVYDDKSKELGHGGPPVLGNLGTTISSDSGMVISFYREQDIGTYIGTEGIGIRAVKTLKWPDGTNLYVDTTTEAIPGDDQRLTTILNKYAVKGSDELTKGQMVVDDTKTDQVMADIKNAFFSDMQNLASPEKDKIQAIQVLLSDFLMKQ